MSLVVNAPVQEVIGTKVNDEIIDGFAGDDGTVMDTTAPEAIKSNGLEGDDIIITEDTNDLAAGDMVGDEWSFIDGEWVYDQGAVVVSDYGMAYSYDDVIVTGQGNDVLLGNGGNDHLDAGAGDDRINAGRGDDVAFGGTGNDRINLENGNDVAEGGHGDDVINAGAGDDVVYGDNKDDDLLESSSSSSTTFDGLAEGGAWTMTDKDGQSQISQSASTVAGETYTISFDLAANFGGGHAAGAVEVIWNGEVVDTVEVTTGGFETFEVEVVSTGDEGELSFVAVTPEGETEYDFTGPVISYETDVIIGGEEITVDAFAPGQAKLYQVIDGQLNVFDVEGQEYVAVGDNPGFKINSVGFNIEDNLIYGVAKTTGVDALGNAVKSSDIVMIDAKGEAYLIGDGYYGDYVGDFDNQGNLWTFHSALNRLSVVDVDQLDADGNPTIEHFHFPNGMFGDRTYDIAFNAADDAFYAVIAPGANGQSGKVVKIDVSGVLNGGTPTFSELAITGTLIDGEMHHGMAKGAYGAVFMDGQGNLYFGLNKGDHDLDRDTGTQGAIYKVNMDWDEGQAYAIFMSEAPSTSSNDGAVDPQSSDAFAEVDADAAVLLTNPTLTLTNGGNDKLNGGNGNDEMYGNGGDDILNGAAGDDVLSGDQGDDLVNGGTGNDTLSGGTGDDRVIGKSGDDTLFGDEGQDYLNGGIGDDTLNGGAGVDKIVGGTGSDIIEGGAGDDNLWGGHWTGDNKVDTFVFKAGSGKDYVHDFEAGTDLIDLSSYGVSFDEVAAVSTDLGWATIIDLQDLTGGVADDRIVLKSVDLDDLSADSFIF